MIKKKRRNTGSCAIGGSLLKDVLDERSITAHFKQGLVPIHTVAVKSLDTLSNSMFFLNLKHSTL